jgi:hypothetical protein
MKYLAQKTCCLKLLLFNLTNQMVHHLTSQKDTNQIHHVKNDLSNMT